MIYPKMKNYATDRSDHYKLQHPDTYPEGITWSLVAHSYRKSRLDDIGDGLGPIEHATVFGLQGLLHELHYRWNEEFFDLPVDAAIEDGLRRIVENTYPNTSPGFIKRFGYDRWRELHAYGRLPIKVKALPEGTQVPVPFDAGSPLAVGARVPMFTIENTDPRFAWFPEFLETSIESDIWQPTTDATLAAKAHATLKHFADLTSDNPEKVFYQAGDFSARGMAGTEAAYRGSAAHLLFFGVSSTIKAARYLWSYYNAPDNVNAYGPSTEHSVACSWGRNEEVFLRKLITEFYPDGNSTHVSDSYDFWGLVEHILPLLKDDILKRDGKFSLRPDSGDPYLVLTGNPKSENPYERKGLIQCLWELFGGFINSKGFKVLDFHIGATYGDAITPAMIHKICKKLMEMGFDTTCVTLGIGSYTYQMNTRDTLGQAYKLIAMTRNGEFYEVFKDPKTDKVDGHNFKKSQRGLVVVIRGENGDPICIDGLNPETIKQYEDQNMLRTTYVEGDFEHLEDFSDMREYASTELDRVYRKAV
jgi:Nicotinic acid phosphoribosyltransferase